MMKAMIDIATASATVSARNTWQNRSQSSRTLCMLLTVARFSLKMRLEMNRNSPAKKDAEDFFARPRASGSR
jgi:hypothetical protein